MFYEPEKKNHGLPHDPFKSLVVPRPIGWISTLDAAGRPNLAPYSFFNGVCTDPPCVMFGASAENRRKDSQANAEATGEFVVNLATFAQRDQVNRSAATLAPGESEFAFAGLEMLPSRLVKAPRVKGAPVHFECRYFDTVTLPSSYPGRPNYMILGQVIGVHIADALVTDGIVDIIAARPIARLGYRDYAVIAETFQMRRPH